MKQMKRRKKACNNMINRNDIMNRNIKIKKDAHKICRQKREYCLNHSLKKWKLLTITMKQDFYQEMNIVRKGFKPQTLPIRDKEGNTVNNKEMVKTKVV